jgi:hypothetical protein
MKKVLLTILGIVFLSGITFAANTDEVTKRNPNVHHPVLRAAGKVIKAVIPGHVNKDKNKDNRKQKPVNN